MAQVSTYDDLFPAEDANFYHETDPTGSAVPRKTRGGYVVNGFRGSNSTGSQINKGQAVFVNATGASIALADADDATKMPAIGIAIENIANGSDGGILTLGHLVGLDTSSLSVGPVYVATTPGGLTSTPPATGQQQPVGVCLVSHATTGELFVKIDETAQPMDALTATDALSADDLLIFGKQSDGYNGRARTRTNMLGDLAAAANLGTVSSGSVTPSLANGQVQRYVNNGAHTLNVPAGDGLFVIEVTNGASAGAITFSGYVTGMPIGDTLNTTNGNIFTLQIWRINGRTRCTVIADTDNT